LANEKMELARQSAHLTSITVSSPDRLHKELDELKRGLEQYRESLADAR
jgi:hypothetical protein